MQFTIQTMSILFISSHLVVSDTLASPHSNSQLLAISQQEPDYSKKPHNPSTITEFDEKKALRLSQSAIGRTLADHYLLNRDGKSVNLLDYRGKPLLISFIYTSCFHTCPLITQHLAQAIKIARSAVGDTQFSVVSIGFDTRHDSPENMSAFSRKNRVSRDPGWEFLSATNENSMQRLTDDLGFTFQRTLNGFNHLAQISVIDAQGKVYRQIYGENFNPPILVETLKELVFGEKSTDMSLERIINKVKLWCTVYDPKSNQYRFNYAMVLGFGISFIFFGIFVFILTRMWISLLKSSRNSF